MTYYTAIVFYQQGHNQANSKFRNVTDPAALDRWLQRNRPAALYVNYYFKADKKFSHRQWLQHFQGA